MKDDYYLQRCKRRRRQYTKLPLEPTANPESWLHIPLHFATKWSDPSTLADRQLQIVALSYGKVSTHQSLVASSEHLKKAYNLLLPFQFFSSLFISLHQICRSPGAKRGKIAIRCYHCVWSVCSQHGFVLVGHSTYIKNHSNSFRCHYSFLANVR